ncbi:hypothetical protein COMA1_20141 [Candidatus Nitrospira nitrosa]|uniref:Uncharacterized protein n=1 Tax=Candidatus Nitrospira nitrosa TaxID=1742972 RepID=A0A0S4LGN5_9BACT|nr:hypothetical protein COMA1_20141 [Candidatus Nitrospira nitrosa]
MNSFETSGNRIAESQGLDYLATVCADLYALKRGHAYRTASAIRVAGAHLRQHASWSQYTLDHPNRWERETVRTLLTPNDNPQH